MDYSKNIVFETGRSEPLSPQEDSAVNVGIKEGGTCLIIKNKQAVYVVPIKGFGSPKGVIKGAVNLETILNNMVFSGVFKGL